MKPSCTNLHNKIMKSIYVLMFSLLSVFYLSCSTSAEHTDSSESPSAESEYHNEDNAPEHTVITLKKQDFAFTVRTGGRIMVDKKAISIVTAKSSGIVRFRDHLLFPGVWIGEGKELFTVGGDQLTEGNAELRLKQLKYDLDKASADYERARSLIADQIITQGHFLEIKNEYEKTLNEFNNLNTNAGSSGQMISSSVSGYIREIFVTEGQMVTPGQSLASISTGNSMVLQADIFPEYLSIMAGIDKASFTTGHSKKLYKTWEMNGSRISYGRSTGDNSFYIPVFFRIDYDPELVEGTYAEVYLIGKNKKNTLVVPQSSLMEEYGKLFVFVENGDGDFTKRYITVGNSDGELTEVIEGLEENETIVATGTYNIKLALMTNSMPAHSHNH
jgi:cobalt-zinc-cadmium efflux system membrane fusion protein